MFISCSFHFHFSFISFSFHFHFIFISFIRVKYAAIEADLYSALPKQKLNNLITVIQKGEIYTKSYMQ